MTLAYQLDDVLIGHVLEDDDLEGYDVTRLGDGELNILHLDGYVLAGIEADTLRLEDFSI